MNETIDFSLFGDFGTALLIGALIGIEREKRKATEKEHDIAGLRTFTVIALIGAIAGWLDVTLVMPWILPATLLSVTLAIVAGYVVKARAQPESLGLTTEAAALTVISSVSCPGWSVASSVSVSATCSSTFSLENLLNPESVTVRRYVPGFRKGMR